MKWDNEDKLKNYKKCLEKNQKWVCGNSEYFLIKVVLEIVSVDEKVSAKESRHPEAEEETLEVNNSFGEECEASDESKPFHQVLVWVVAGESVVSTFVRCAESERVKSEVSEAECEDENNDERDGVEEESETMVNGVPTTNGDENHYENYLPA